ncbi:histidine kinase [Croceivirga lutea]|uniref:2TM domain-containing protein n=1 Tax=Croceivirga lutea TaxID=1775167 RepID=UPI00163A05FE|nr:2TM domain-containing protein [Croceivirga lutea]GGG48005.1 histidine kinase [Croceivirga lutea]
MQELNRENKYTRAKERVDELKKFYSNLTSYIIVISALAALNYWVDGWSYPWFLWAAFGWGIGVFFHAINTFRWNPLFNKDWEERKIKEFMDKDKNQSKWE